MHRTPSLSTSAQILNGSAINGEPVGTPQQPTESVLSNAANKMREKLAALEDLNELLEEPVEEQVRTSFFFVITQIFFFFICF